MDDVETPNRSPVTNTEISRTIGLSDAMVSRIRDGHRLPSMSTMYQIQKFYHWDLAKQITSREEGRYARDFEMILWGAP